MKICATCHQKYADSLQYCLADGTVLSPLPDPDATLRIDARPTQQSGTPAKRSVSVGVVAGLVLVAIIGIVAFILLYSGWSNKAAIDPNRPNNLAVSTSDAANSDPGSAIEQEIKKLKQINSDLCISMVQSDVAAIDRLLAFDYLYSSDLGRNWSFNKEQTLTAYRTGQVRYSSVTAPDPKVEMNQDLTRAVVSGRAYASGRLGGAPFNNSYLYQNIYEKRQNDWRLVRVVATYRQ
jgi:uncharacterized protein DUF4440